ncbi:MAG: CPBP family intramembrane metalloprotease [Ruminococcus flavefaciens]|nr:CPBP family intramembrane metalloprotease [Ruminococcus flavefaciens]MCM1362658.1 CPBP family intramembrane metalloprotease [Clostridiales bacterium]
MKQLLKNICPFNDRTEMPKIIYVIKIILAFWACKIVGEVLAEGVAILIHFALGKNPLEGEMFDSQTITLITYYGYIIVIGIVLLYWKIFQKKTLSEMGIIKNFGNYFIGAMIGIILVVTSAAAIMLTGMIKCNGIFKSIDFVMILLMLGGFIIQGAMEEFLCRGIVLCSLKNKTSIPVAIGISTSMFIIPHLSSLSERKPIYVVIGILNLILISIIFSLFTLKFNSILAACGLHSIWNFILFSILGLNLSGKDETTEAIFDLQSVGENILNGVEYDIEASIITAVVLVADAALIWYLSRKKTDTE